MASALTLRPDFAASALCRPAKCARDKAQSRQLLSLERKAQRAARLESGPDRASNGIVRRRRVDLQGGTKQ